MPAPDARQRWPIPLLLLTLTTMVGCAAHPKDVFFDSTRAFAQGDVDRGMAHFSRRLKQQSSKNDLEYYYSFPDNRAGVEFLLEDARFQMVAEDESTALARVIWTHGRVEPVYFVREDGIWRIDAAPVEESGNATRRDR